MSNLPNSKDVFQRISNKVHQENIHEELHNSLAQTVEALQKYSGAIQVSALPVEGEPGAVYTLISRDGDNEPGIYLCTSPSTYMSLASRGQGWVIAHEFTNESTVEVEHGLNSFGVFAKAFDEEMNEIEYDEYKIIDADNIRVKFSVPTSGTIIILSSGRDGGAPEHEWNGTNLRFKNPNGTWGEWIDLIAEIENKGDKGDTGPMPAHEWNGTQLRFKLDEDTWGDWIELKGATGASPEYQWNGTEIRFKNPDGSWGPFVNLKGEAGSPGADGTSVKWERTYSGLSTYDVGDLVYYEGQSYIRILEGANGIPPTNEEYWDLVVKKGEDGGSVGPHKVMATAGEEILCQGNILGTLGVGEGDIKVGTPLIINKIYNASLYGMRLNMRKIGTPIGSIFFSIYKYNDGVKEGTPSYVFEFNASEVNAESTQLSFSFVELQEFDGEYDLELTSLAGDDSNYIVLLQDEYTLIKPQSTPVYIHTDGRVFVSQDAGNRNKFDGFVSTKVSEDQDVEVIISGVKDLFNGLSIASEYFLSDELGQITSTRRAIKLGKSISDSKMLIEKEVPLIPNRMLERTSEGLGAVITNLSGQSPAKLIGSTPSSILSFINEIKREDISITQDLGTGDYHMYNSEVHGQSFTVGADRFFNGIAFFLSKYNSPSGPIYAKLYSCVDGLPSTKIKEVRFDRAQDIDGNQYTTFDFDEVELETGLQYAVVLHFPTSSTNNRIYVKYNNTNVYNDGTAIWSFDNGVSFITRTTDLQFKAYFSATSKKTKVGISIDGVSNDNLSLPLSRSFDKTLVSQTLSNTQMPIYGSTNMAGQSVFFDKGIAVSQINFSINKVNNPTGNLILNIYELDSTYTQIGAPLATASLAASSLSTGYVQFPIEVFLEKNKHYGLVLSLPDGNNSNRFDLNYYNSSQYSNGRIIYLSSGYWNNLVGDAAFSVIGSELSFSSYEDIASILETAIRNTTGKKERVVYDGVFKVISSINNKSSVINKFFSPLDGIDISGNGATPFLNLGDDASIVDGYGDENSLMINDDDGNEQSSFVKVLAGEKIVVNDTPVPVYIEGETILNKEASDVFLNRSNTGTINMGAYSTYNVHLCQPLDTGEYNAFKSVKVKINKVGSPAGYVFAELALLDVNNYPTTILAASNQLNATSITSVLEEYTFTFTDAIVPLDTRIGLVINAQSIGESGNYIQVAISTHLDDSMPFGTTKMPYGSSWTSNGGSLHCFISAAREGLQEREAGKAYVSYGESDDIRNRYDGLITKSINKNEEVKVYVNSLIKNINSLSPGKSYYVSNFMKENQALAQGDYGSDFGTKKGQAFTTLPTDYSIKKIDVKLSKQTSGTVGGLLTMNLYEADIDGLPTGSSLGQKSIGSDITYNQALQYSFIFDSAISVEANKKYVVVIEHSGSNNNLRWYGDNESGGLNWNGSAWIANSVTFSLKIFSNNPENIKTSPGSVEIKCGKALSESIFKLN